MMATSLSSAKRVDGSAPPKRYQRDDGYGRSTRFYEVEGEKLPSVTAILQAVAKPALVGWAAKQEREMVIRAATQLYEDLPALAPKMNRMAYENTLQERVGKTKAYQRELSKASDIGTECHALIEWNLRRELQQKVGPEPRISDKATWAFMAYEDWRKKANLAPVLIEQTVYSKRYGYAGTMDWAGEIDHEGTRVAVVGDFKTGKAIYAEALLQNAAYVHALREMGLLSKEVGGCIVRLPKTEADPEFEVRVISPEAQKELFRVFLSVRELWGWLDGASK
jgi:hypothetical protein